MDRGEVTRLDEKILPEENKHMKNDALPLTVKTPTEKLKFTQNEFLSLAALIEATPGRETITLGRNAANNVCWVQLVLSMLLEND